MLIVECSNYPKIKNSLNLYEDEYALIRSKTIISEVEEIDFKRRYPILLRSGSYFTKLIVLRAHARMCHQGTECTLNHIRGEYWVIRGRQVVKTILKKCVLCKFVHAKTALPPSSANLPNYRVTCNYAL